MAEGAARRTRTQVIVVLVLAVAVAAFLSVSVVGHHFFDLRVYAGALHYWAREGGQIYDWLKPRSRYGFTYPPFAALVMLPLAYLPWRLSVGLSVLATVLASVALLWWLLDPLVRRTGWRRWFVVAVAFCLVAAFEPMRETVDFGQVNVLLLTLVAADLLWLVARGGRWAGVGIGLATAIKLTPGIFIVYLLITGRWRAAATATATAVAATVLAAAVAPDASREFWTEALWNTNRVGELAFISNQSLQGVVARLEPTQPNQVLWLAAVGVVLAVWVWRSWIAAASGDEVGGLALTGVAGCLVSPVTWVHHLVWLIPALVLLVDRAHAAPARSPRRGWSLGLAVIAYALLTSRLVWTWERGSPGLTGFLGSNAYVWVSIALLLAVPVGRVGRLESSGPQSSGGPLRRHERCTVNHVGEGSGDDER